MTKYEVLKALRFFHDISLIMHFDTPELKNSVIVEAKPLIDMVSQLISALFVDQTFLTEHCKMCLSSQAKDLLQHRGRFTENMLKEFLMFDELVTVQFFSGCS